MRLAKKKLIVLSNIFAMRLVVIEELFWICFEVESQHLNILTRRNKNQRILKYLETQNLILPVQKLLLPPNIALHVVDPKWSITLIRFSFQVFLFTHSKLHVSSVATGVCREICFRLN